MKWLASAGGDGQSGQQRLDHAARRDQREKKNCSAVSATPSANSNPRARAGGRLVAKGGTEEHPVGRERPEQGRDEEHGFRRDVDLEAAGRRQVDACTRTRPEVAGNHAPIGAAASEADLKRASARRCYRAGTEGRAVMRLLLIEDDDILGEGLRDFLCATGHERRLVPQPGRRPTPSAASPTTRC